MKIRRISFLLTSLFGLVVVVLTSFISGPLYAAEGVDPIRVERLAKGINLPGWLWLNRGDLAPIETRYPDSDLRRIKQLGFTHVRIPMDMANIHDPEASNLLNKKAIEVLDPAIKKILDLKLAVIIDLHSISQNTGGSDYSGPLGKDESFTDTFAAFWSELAKHLSQFDQDWLILEPMNEPVLRGNEENWPPVQKKIVSAIRRNAPNHTILATGARWSNLSTLLELAPLEDPNIIYNFHFYEPHIFTHQGATWSSDIVKPLREIPYPSSPYSIKPLLENYKDQRTKKALEDYGEERWNSAKIDKRIKLAGDWASKHGVPVICDEWGVYRSYSLPQHRAQWIEDVRTALEKYGIGWCMWNFDGGFGLVNRMNGEAVPDHTIVKALGLNTNIQMRR